MEKTENKKKTFWENYSFPILLVLLSSQYIYVFAKLNHNAMNIA